jgi:hypothetical protein
MRHIGFGKAGIAGTALLVLAGAGLVFAGPGMIRWFVDRPVAWNEHDDANVPALPETNHLQEVQATLTIRDNLANEADRILAAEGPLPAEDVNAVDEVPCSTWYCARNHLHPMSLEEIATGSPGSAPTPPFTIVKGKDEGAASGFQVVDAKGKKFMLKLDPRGHLGLQSGAEMIGYRLFHAAGYNVPGAFLVDIDRADLRLDPHATFKLLDIEKRPLTEARVATQLSGVAQLPGGRLRTVEVPWLRGQVLGSFDMLGVRPGDPNDRIPHERRRSLRASWVLFAWLSVLDAGSINTLDTYVEEGGRHFIRHYFFDFGCSFGSATAYAQGPQQDGEFLIEVGRSLAALFSFGLYQRPFQAREERQTWQTLDAEYPAVGYFPAEDFDPDSYRGNRRVPAHMRITAGDAYWGAKVVTAFTDAQVHAVVATARYSESDGAYVEHALRVRRDILGRRYLRAVAAIESPGMSPDGSQVCFDDLAIDRGYAGVLEARYLVEVSDGHGVRVAGYQQAAAGSHACVPIGGVGAGTGYRVVSIREQLAGGAGHPDTPIGKPARIHLRWRAGERRFVVVGLERDE